MQKVTTAAMLSQRFSAKYATPIDLAASGTEGALDKQQSELASGGTLATVQAHAVRAYSAGATTLQFVKATEHFYVGGEVQQPGDFVQVTEAEARMLVSMGRAELATDAEVTAAQTPAKGK